MTLILSGTNGLSDVDGDASTPAVRGTDANTGIFFGSDIIGFSEGGAECARFNADAQFVAAAGTASLPVITTTGDVNTGIFFPAADTIAFAEGGAEAMRIDSSGNLLVGTTTSAGPLTVDSGSGATGFININSPSLTDANQTLGFSIQDGNHGVFLLKDGSGIAINELLFKEYGGVFKWINANTSAVPMTLDGSGNLLVGNTSYNSGLVGVLLSATGDLYATVNGGASGFFNRLTNDGDLVIFQQASVTEGSISVSGNTVSYNPFLGSHSGALADWSRPDIKIGTVMDTIDELLEYKVVVIDVQEEVPAKEAVMDEEGNEVEPAQEATTQTVQKRISYNGNGVVGSSATVEYEGEEYTGTIQHEREEPLSFNKHLKVKVNDTAASKAVFGVFVGWNNDSNNDGGVYNDMLVGAVGNYVIRMAAGQEPQVGDLVEADGNGCAVVQDDDIIRTKTIAKVTSTIKQVTYDDGSFLVTCVLYCG